MWFLGCPGSASSTQFRNQTLSVFESLLTIRIEEEHRYETDSVMLVHSETEDILMYDREKLTV